MKIDTKQLRDALLEQDWQRERRDAWVKFAASMLPLVENFTTCEAALAADVMLAEFDERFGKEEAK